MKYLFLLLLAVALLPTTTFAQTPRTISYQGVLTDANGNLISDGSHGLTLRIYDQALGGTLLYEEATTVTVLKGTFNVVMGTVNAIPGSLTFDRPYYLAVSVDGGSELVPRTALTAVPYALYADVSRISDVAIHARSSDTASMLAASAPGVVRSVNGRTGNLTLRGSGSTTVSNIGDTLLINSSGGSGGGSAWSLSGDVGTNPTTNYIGTNDSADFVIRSSSREQLRVRVDGSIVPARGRSRQSTYIGEGAGSKDTAATQSTGYGYHSLSSLRTGLGNTGVGTDALTAIDSGDYNTAVGNRALVKNSTGHRNTALGATTMAENTIGAYNTAIGGSALRDNKIGSDNVAVGYRSLLLDSNGFGNTSIGARAMYSHVSGNNNVAIGDSALYTDSTGYANTAVGGFALSSNLNGSHATALGFRAMKNIVARDVPQIEEENDNTAVGADALMGSDTLANNVGSGNTAVGAFALRSNGKGDRNAALGLWSLISNSTGAYNSAIGAMSLFQNTTGDGNTSIGGFALASNSTGGGNTALGVSSMTTNTVGSNNTVVGAGADVAENNFSNATAIGYQAVSTGSNKVRIGNSSVTSIGGQVGWTTLSDERVKHDVANDVIGLDFIMKLRPVTYNYSLSSIYQQLGRIDSSVYPEKNNIEKMRFSGFLAQEVDLAAKSVGYEFSGVDHPSSEKDLYGIRYSNFVVPIVKAVQEQQSEIDKLRDADAVIVKLEQTVANLEQRIKALEERLGNQLPVVK